MASTDSWQRFNEWYLEYPGVGFSIDVSRMRFGETFIGSLSSKIERAFEEMAELEKGAIANPDEDRMVGHYWLRAPRKAPTAELRDEIESVLAEIKTFAREVHEGKHQGHGGKPLTQLLLIGIGGSALGPQFVADALGGTHDKMTPHFFDNTDPDGFARVFARLEGRLEETLVVVVSKSGGTKETRNGMLAAQDRFSKAGIPFGPQAVAVTGKGSHLDQVAESEGWLRRFPMWDWVGGRTSVMSAVGLVPMALQGVDVDSFLKGAAQMDELTRSDNVRSNAAMLLALMWYYAGDGLGKRDMVVLPYKDRLMLFSKYLQQLVMESLGKEKDLDGNVVHQGIAVYGNKGSTDQHAYVQQLRDGVPNFFVTFIEVRAPGGDQPALEVDPGVQSGDYLQGFLRGTRDALSQNGRESICVSIPVVNPETVGGLIALYERAVGFYGSLVRVNAYHQPGVEAGKKAAQDILDLQAKVMEWFGRHSGREIQAEELAGELEACPETVYHILTHLAASRENLQRHSGEQPAEDRFSAA